MKLIPRIAGLCCASLLCAEAQTADTAMELARQTLAKLTLEEKLSLCHGNSTVTINAIPRVGLNEEFVMSDGPHNVRPDLDRKTFNHASRNDDYSTSLPSLSALAATWDVALAARHGQLIGQEAGNALTPVLFGDVNPSGKLPFTFPRRLADSPAHALNQYNGEKVNYAEELLVGYRWFDKKQIEPLFPFGFGLSYTTFRYNQIKLAKPGLKPGDSVAVTVDITNTGKLAGAEVVQLYVSDPKPQIGKAVRELKGFAKVALKPDETETVSLTLTPRDFAYFDVPGHQWKADAGEYVIEVGASSRDLRQKATVKLEQPFSEASASLSRSELRPAS